MNVSFEQFEKAMMKMKEKNHEIVQLKEQIEEMEAEIKHHVSRLAEKIERIETKDKQIEELTDLLERVRDYISVKTPEGYALVVDVNATIKKVRG